MVMSVYLRDLVSIAVLSLVTLAISMALYLGLKLVVGSSSEDSRVDTIKIDSVSCSNGEVRVKVSNTGGSKILVRAVEVYDVRLKTTMCIHRAPVELEAGSSSEITIPECSLGDSVYQVKVVTATGKQITLTLTGATCG